jgi:hypothetical protein
VRIERVRIDGFGTLSRADISWPEDRLLLVVDQNETGKTTLCEAVVTALYGLPRGRGQAPRVRELRRPRSGAPLRVGLDLSAAERRFSVDRDLDAGTVRIVDRDRGLDVTREFLRPGGRDAFGEIVTGGLTEALFRASAYVSQNVLDRDSLDSTLTVELARIADSGGGEASVVRALGLLEAARKGMPGATTGSAVSVDTEIVRLSRKLEALRAERTELAGYRDAAAEASARLSARVRARDDTRRRSLLADIEVLEAERRALARRLAELTASREALRSAESEAATLARDAELFGGEALAEIDALRERRGARPQALREARAALGAARADSDRAESDRARTYGEALRLPDEERRRARTLLEASIEAGEERAAAESALAAQWEELRKEGLADDLAKLEALPPAERGFVAAADDERASRELEGVRLDRKVADAAALVAIIAGERRERVKRARALVVVACLLAPAVLVLAWMKASVAVTAAAGAFAVALGLFGGVAWVSGSRHRLSDQARAGDDERSHRQKAVEVRRRLSELRQRLDRTARAAGFPDASALVRAHRRLRAADERRRALLSRAAQRDAASDRVGQLSAELAPLGPALGLAEGPPPPEAARRALALLSDLEVRLEEDRTAAAVRAREEERLAREGAELAVLEERLRSAFARAGAPPGLAFGEAFAFVEAGRRRAARRKELLEVEIPARREVFREEEIGELTDRTGALALEIRTRLGALGLDETALPGPLAPEAARRAAAEARAALEAAEGDCLSAERELGAAARRGGERARACEESLDEAEGLLRRATLFRDALDLAHRTLTASAAAVYGDFRRGLSRASRAILESWRVPYEALEFGDDLSLTAIARGGRVATKGEIQSALSTGAREQLHLTARLAVLRYLGTGAAGVPLLLDDPLTGADDERFVSVMQFLVSNVLAERPVLLVSCHGWRHERLLEALPAEVSGKLARVSLAPFSSRAAVAAGPGPRGAAGPGALG